MANLLLKGVRFSFVRVFEPEAFEGKGEPKYSVTLLIPKDSDAAAAIVEAFNKVEAEIPSKYPKLKGQAPDPKRFASWLKDGDIDGIGKGEEYEGHLYVSAKRVERLGKPIVIDARKAPLTSPEDVYSGCWGNASISVYPYESGGNYGISAGLNGIQKVHDGERLDGGASVSAFDVEGDDIFG